MPSINFKKRASSEVAKSTGTSKAVPAGLTRRACSTLSFLVCSSEHAVVEEDCACLLDGTPAGLPKKALLTHTDLCTIVKPTAFQKDRWSHSSLPATQAPTTTELLCSTI